jgi:hypothetical protein
MISAAGEDQRVQQGLFENYLEAKVKDPHLGLVSFVTVCAVLIDCSLPPGNDD